MKPEDICIICINPAFGNAGALQRAIGCNIVAQSLEFKGFHKNCTKPIKGFQNIPKAKHYIFAGSGVMLRIDISKLTGRKSVIISDSHYLEHTEEIDQIIEENHIEVSCMLDLWYLCKHEKRAYFQPFEQIKLSKVKNKKLTICHSPSVKVLTNQKGSAQIKSAVDRAIGKKDIHYECITTDTWSGSMEKKAKSHIFIDQLVISNHYQHKGYAGGIGKSGLEAMLLKCLTISCGTPIDTDVPAPPYVVANTVDELAQKLKYYIENKNERKLVITKQYEWAKKYTSLKNVAKRLLA